MDDLPASKTFGKRDVFRMMVEHPLEGITRSLLKGDGFEGEYLDVVYRRCKALCAAYEARWAAEINEVTE